MYLPNNKSVQIFKAVLIICGHNVHRFMLKWDKSFDEAYAKPSCWDFKKYKKLQRVSLKGCRMVGATSAPAAISKNIIH